MGQAHPTLCNILMLSALAAGPERVDPTLCDEFIVRIGNRNRGVRTVFSHQQSLDGARGVAIFVTMPLPTTPTATIATSLTRNFR